MLTALEKWVEHDTPPDSIDVTYRLGNPQKGNTVERRHLLCPYPDQSVADKAMRPCGLGLAEAPAKQFPVLNMMFSCAARSASRNGRNALSIQRQER